MPTVAMLGASVPQAGKRTRHSIESIIHKQFKEWRQYEPVHSFIIYRGSLPEHEVGCLFVVQKNFCSAYQMASHRLCTACAQRYPQAADKNGLSSETLGQAIEY
jgi:hypothetical protein